MEVVKTESLGTSRNVKKKENKSYPLKKPLCNPFLPETFQIWWGPSETPFHCYRAETLCLGSRRQELGGWSAGRQSGSKIYNWDRKGKRRGLVWMHLKLHAGDLHSLLHLSSLLLYYF